MDQLMPFHCSSKAPPVALASKSPAAKQVVELGHNIDNSSAEITAGGLALATIDQLVPSQCSISGVELKFSESRDSG